MAFLDFPVFKMLSARMGYDSDRQVILSQNLANIDTPGYKPRDLEPLEFKDMLVGGSSRLPMATTSPMHISKLSGMSTSFNVIQQAQTFETKPNGNAVSLEEQMSKIAENQTDFQLSSSVYQKMNALLRSALGQA